MARSALSWPLGLAACAILTSAVPAFAQTAARAPASRWRVQRMPDGRPDLQGTWTNNTATPLVRPADLAGKRYFTQEEAAEFERTWLDRLVGTLPEVDRFAADLSEVWFDGAKVVPDRRTSLIVKPKTGLLPPLVQAARDRIAARPPTAFNSWRISSPRSATTPSNSSNWPRKFTEKSKWRSSRLTPHRTDYRQATCGYRTPPPAKRSRSESFERDG